MPTNLTHLTRVNFVRSGVLVMAALMAASVGGGCTTFNSARPLAPGEHAVAVTAGGPLTNVPGIGTIPLPNVTVEGRHGVVNHLDVNYGLHLLPMVFGVQGGHVGGTFQLYDAPHPAVPVVAVGQRFFFFTNLLDTRKVNKDAFAMSQTDLTASWDLWGSLVYGGVTAHVPIDVDDRALFLSPFAGVEIHPGIDWLRLQVEGRWLSPVTNQRFAVVNWQAPADQGAIALNLGAAIEFGDLLATILNGGHDAPEDDPPPDDDVEVSVSDADDEVQP